MKIKLDTFYKWLVNENTWLVSIRLLFWYSVPTGIVVIVVTNWASLMSQLVKNPSANAGDARDVDLIPGWGRSPGERNGNPLQYSCLENPMDRGAWWAKFTGSQRVGQDWACTHTHSHKLVSLFSSGNSNGQRSLEDYSPEGLKELNTTEAT